VEIAEDNIPHLNKFLAAIDFEVNDTNGKPVIRPDGRVQTESIQPTQWFQIPDEPGNLRDPDCPPSCRLVEESQKISIASVTEYVARYIDIVPIPLEVTTSWVTCPKLAAFDIETYSDRKLCLPRKNNPAHSAYLYSVICQKLRDQSSRKRYAIVIGDCDQIPPEKLENTEVISIPYQKNYRRGKAELEAIERFAQIIRDYDPDIITGYNIFGYDYPYIDARLSIFGADFWPRMSRLKKGKNEVGKLKEVNWKSNAYGKQDYQYLDLEGRLSIDLFPVIKREHKLNKYDLSTVSKQFLRKDKIDIKAKEMFEIYERLREENVRWQEMKAGLAKLLPEHDPNEFEHMTEEELKHHQEVGAEFLKCWKLAKEEHQRIKAEILRVVEYCIRDSELVIDLFERLNIWTSLREMSNITRVSIVDVLTHGQELSCVAQLYNLARREGFVVNKRNAPAFKFNGGFVFEVKPGVYRLVICLDFASLYPNIIRAYNICHTTLIPPEWLHLTDEHGNPLYGEHNCHVIEFEQEEFVTEEVSEEKEILREIKGGSKPKSVKTGRKLKYRFLWDKTREGILPQLVRELIAARKGVNAIIARYKVQLEEFLEPLYKSGDKTMPPQQVLERLRSFISATEANNKPENKTYKKVQYQISCLTP
jgi:DNA polymerase elongation subunit (family B)